MIIEEEIQKIIDTYIEQIGEKEDELSAFNAKVNDITTSADIDFDIKVNELDEKFTDKKISQEEYRDSFSKLKVSILEATKENLNSLMESLPRE